MKICILIGVSYLEEHVCKVHDYHLPCVSTDLIRMYKFVRIIDDLYKEIMLHGKI